MSYLVHMGTKARQKNLKVAIAIKSQLIYRIIHVSRRSTQKNEEKVTKYFSISQFDFLFVSVYAKKIQRFSFILLMASKKIFVLKRKIISAAMKASLKLRFGQIHMIHKE